MTNWRAFRGILSVKRCHQVNGLAGRVPRRPGLVLVGGTEKIYVLLQFSFSFFWSDEGLRLISMRGDNLGINSWLNNPPIRSLSCSATKEISPRDSRGEEDTRSGGVSKLEKIIDRQVNFIELGGGGGGSDRRTCEEEF